MKLLVMGDFHYPRMEQGTAELHAAREQLFGGLLKAFLETEADYHISLGDFTNEGYPEEFEYVFGHIRSHAQPRRFVHVLGNHDTYNIPKREILALTGQQRYHSVETDEAVLVFLDTTKEMDQEDYGGEVDPEQTAWLDSVLERSGDKPVLAFGHHPLPDTTALSDLHMLRIHPEYDIWPSLQKKSGPGYYFCGHNHINSIVQKDRWHFIQTAACLDIPAFRMIEIQDGELSVGTIPVQDTRLHELAAFVGAHMIRFKPKADASGREEDRALSVVHR